MNVQINDLLSGIGSLATNIRSAITGELTPEKKAQIETQLIKLEEQVTNSKAKVLIAEIQGKSWLQRNWRPILMMSIIAIIVNNYLLFPYISLFTDKVQMLALPDKLWSLMSIGLGGYVVGRTGEKIVDRLKK